MSLIYEANRYRATILRHVDADTTWVTVDLGFDVRMNLSIRWDGINAPEMSTPEGVNAASYVAGRLAVGESCILTTIKDRREKYGRYLGRFWVNGVCINDELIQMGLAAPYSGGTR